MRTCEYLYIDKREEAVLHNIVYAYTNMYTIVQKFGNTYEFLEKYKLKVLNIINYLFTLQDDFIDILIAHDFIRLSG